MRAPPSAAVRVFRELYPKSEPNDPESLSEYGEYFLAPELRVELDLFYGALDKNDSLQRKARRPGVDYNDLGWRNRMAKWYYHAELFQIFSKLDLRSWEIDEVCTWWGSKAEVDAFEETHPGMVLGDDIWDGIAVAPRVGPPVAYFHEPGSSIPPPPRKRSSRLRRMIPRPKAIRGWTDLSHSARSSTTHSSDSQAPDLLMTEPPSPEEDDLMHSVGVSLNRDLHSGHRNQAFDEWYKDELDNGHLPSVGSSSVTRPASYQQPFQVNTNTISYRATPHHHMTMPSYTQRMMGVSQGLGGMMPVAVGMAEAVPRSGQARQSSLGRYQLPRQYQYRPIRPRPMRQPSRGHGHNL